MSFFKLKVRDKFKSQLWLVFLMFILIFAPPIIPQINIIIPVSLILGILIFAKYRKDLVSLIKQIPWWFLMIIIVFMFYLITIIIASIISNGFIFWKDYLITIYRFGILGCVGIYITYLILFAKKHFLTKFDFLELIIWAFIIQLIICILAIIIPAFKQYLVTVMYMNTGDAVLLNRYHVERRFYGFANNLLDTFGYGVGIATGLAAFIAFMRKKYQMLILIPGFLTLAFFNARTGIFIGILGVIIVLGWMVITGSKKLKLIAVAVAIAIALMTPLSLNFLKVKQPVTYYWLYHDFYSIMIKFFGDNGKTIVKDNTANNLFSDRFWFLPSGKELVFGSGHSIYQVPGYKHSDVGYVNDIWLLGGIGFAFLSSIVIFIFSKIAMMDKRMVSIAIFMILALLIFQIKARAIMANAGFVISLMIVASSYLPAPARSQEKISLVKRKWSV